MLTEIIVKPYIVITSYFLVRQGELRVKTSWE